VSCIRFSSLTVTVFHSRGPWDLPAVADHVPQQAKWWCWDRRFEAKGWG